MIGHVTSSNAKNLLKVQNLSVVEAVDSEKLAKKLDSLLEAEKSGRKLRVMVQVNTSGEESKYGVEPDAAIPLCQFVHSNCPNLKLSGLMTIGKLHGDPVLDFQKLIDVRTAVSAALKLPLIDLELSMGMSSDYEIALR